MKLNYQRIWSIIIFHSYFIFTPINASIDRSIGLRIHSYPALKLSRGQEFWASATATRLAVHRLYMQTVFCFSPPPSPNPPTPWTGSDYWDQGPRTINRRRFVLSPDETRRDIRRQNYCATLCVPFEVLSLLSWSTDSDRRDKIHVQLSSPTKERQSTWAPAPPPPPPPQGSPPFRRSAVKADTRLMQPESIWYACIMTSFPSVCLSQFVSLGRPLQLHTRSQLSQDMNALNLTLPSWALRISV